MSRLRSYLYVLPLLLLLLMACEERPPLGVQVYYAIDIRNLTDRKLITSYSLSYPDTSIPPDLNRYAGMLPGGKQQFSQKTRWEASIDEAPRNTISFFFIDQDTLARYGWDRVRSEYRIYRRMDMGTPYLEANDWTVTIQ